MFSPPETTAETTVETTLPPETTEETIPVPQTTCGTARVHNTPAVLSIRMRGDQVDVVGEYDENHYVIKTAEGYGLARKELIRLEGEAACETWTGYAAGIQNSLQTFILPVNLIRNYAPIPK